MSYKNVRYPSANRILFFLLLPAIFLALAGTAGARSSYLTTFNTTYGTSATKLNACSTCHGSGGNSTFNPYGQDVRSRIGSGIAAALAAVEPLDSDGDGYTNIVEINARTFPGDAADFPAPSDTTRPTVSATNPVNGATAVSVSTAVTASFSEAVKNVSTATFQLKAGAASVSGAVTLNGTTATFTPSASLAYGTTYTATLTTGVTDLANNALAADYSWSFTTGAASDTTRPTVGATSPTSGQTGVAVNTAVTATFSEAVKNVSAATFQLRAGGAVVNGAVSLNGTTATFTPSAGLAFSTTYTATVTTGVMDLANNALAADYSWSFTTGAASDTTPPTVTATTPVNGAMAVSVNAAVTATFSETIDAASVNATTFTLKDGSGASVAGVVTASGNNATFTPSAALNVTVTYTATLTTGVKDLAGNALAAAHSWSFTTVAGSVDSDKDGVGDSLDRYPTDSRKATPLNPLGSGDIVIDTSKNTGTRLTSVEAMSDTDPNLNQSGKPAGFRFDYGMVSYRVEGVAPGATIQVKITLPAVIPPQSKAFKVDSSGFHEYAQVSFKDSTMTVTLTDGGEGDSDGTANGVVVDPIGLAAPAESPPAAAPAEAAGGGCSISGANGNGGSAAASYGLLLLLAVAMLAARAVTRRANRR